MAQKPIVAEVALKHLPILRHSEVALSELRSRTSTSLNHISRVVERDPCLVYELFAHVNRDLKRAGRAPATHIRRALLIFGITRYLDHTKSYQALENTIQAPILPASLNHLGRSCTAARLAETLATLHGGINPEEAFSFALVKDFDNYASFIIESSKASIDWRNARTLLPGLALPAVSGDPLHWCVEAALRFATACQFAWDPLILIPQIQSIAERLTTQPEKLAHKLRTTILSVSRETKHFNDFPPARFLAHPGPNEPAPTLLFSADSLQALVEPPSKAPRRPTLDRLKARRTDNVPFNDLGNTRRNSFFITEKNIARISDALTKAVLDLEKLGASKASRPRVLPYAMNVMLKILRIERALFIAHPGDTELIARLQIRQDESPTLIQRPLVLRDNPVLRKALKEPVSRHFTSTQLEKHEQLFDEELSVFLGTNEVYSLPLRGKNKLIGIILVRMSRQTTDQWPQHFELTCHWCEQIVRVLDSANA